MMVPLALLPLIADRVAWYEPSSVAAKAAEAGAARATAAPRASVGTSRNWVVFFMGPSPESVRIPRWVRNWFGADRRKVGSDASTQRFLRLAPQRISPQPAHTEARGEGR